MTERCTEAHGGWRCDLSVGHAGQHESVHAGHGKRSTRRWDDPPSRDSDCLVCKHRSAITHYSLLDRGIGSCGACGRLLIDNRKPKTTRDAQEADAADLLYSLGAP